MNHEEPPQFKEFLQDWLSWVNMGAPEGEPYIRNIGLCGSYEFFYIELLNPHLGISKTDVFKYMQGLFGTADPFGAVYKNCHLNDERINWVKEYLNEK